ncbi:13066_t:CDS:2 [Acaulospora colombiana]|uniref:13066_t:CDS:1 n=1 Tax=Acaulospora colombiana TaxID=27376 RepID=A0ACA9M1G5_9GLOM|nr:13066_t:CDS:2 [Acaulospora colombiana]
MPFRAKDTAPQQQHEREIHSQFGLNIKKRELDCAKDFLNQNNCITDVKDAIEFKRNLLLEGEDYEEADQIVRDYLVQILKSKDANSSQINDTISHYNQESFHHYLTTSNSPGIIRIYKRDLGISPENALYVIAAYIIGGDLEASRNVVDRFDIGDALFERFLNNVKTHLSSVEADHLRKIVKYREPHVRSLFKHKKFDDARNLYKEIIAEKVEPDEHIYDAFIFGFLYYNLFQDAMQVWEGINKRGFRPTLRLYNRMIHGFGKKSTYHDAEVIWNNMLNNKIRPDVETYGTMIDTYFQSREGLKAAKLFQQMNNENIPLNVEIFNIMINGFLSLNKVDEAKKMYKMMQEKGIKPDVVTCNALIQRLINLNEALAFEILEDMERSNIKPDAMTLTILVEDFLARKDLEGAQKIIDSFGEYGIEPNMITYGVIINGLIKMGDFAKAQETYNIASKIGKPGIQIESNMLQLHFKLKNFDAAMRAHRKIMRSGYKITEGYYNILIGGFMNAGYSQEAKIFYDQMLSLKIHPNLKTYKTLIKGYLKISDITGASEIVDDIKRVNYLVLNPELKELIEIVEKSLRKKSLSNIIK